MIKIDGLNKACVFAALFNAASPQGMTFKGHVDTPMTREEAQKILDDMRAKSNGYQLDGILGFDYFQGRALKFGIHDKTDRLTSFGYDSRNGEGSMEAVVADLRKNGDVNSPFIQQLHAKNMEAARRTLAREIQRPTTSGTAKDGWHEIRLGLAEHFNRN